MVGFEGRQDSFKSCPRVGGIDVSGLTPAAYKVFQVVPPCGGHPQVYEVIR